MERRRCPRCRQLTLVGSEDSNRAALPYRLDPDPVDTMGELAAVVAGCRTWTVHHSGAVHLRTAATIRTRPAGHGWRQQVHADHACTKGEQ